ncbi:MAG: acylphosphatase [Proteobacteria bacterium]|nr:acylphosphatase [Pseudomonadota bacterium]
MPKIYRKHYRFSGQVQGVGFRYRAYYNAQRLGIGGWVRNCADGSVEMEAEGTAEALCDLLDALENGHFIQIDRCTAQDMAPTGEHQFRIQ